MQDVAYLQISNARLSGEVVWLKNISIAKRSKARLQLPSDITRNNVQFKILIEREQQNLVANIAAIKSQLDDFDSQIKQSSQDIVELHTRILHLQANYDLGHEELELTKPLAEQGVVSRVELIKLTRQVNSLKQDLQSNQLLMPKTRAVRAQAKVKRVSFITQKISELKELITQQNQTITHKRQSLVSLNDRLARTTVYSPVSGIVKTVYVNTRGGVISPGMALVDIVPNEDNLLIEAHISPRDVGFLRPGLNTVVRFSAFDFAIYGSLKGTLEHISADTIVDDKGNHLYKIKVRTARNYLGSDDAPMSIIPGMAATVDVITGEKTILNYLLKPIKRAQLHALRER